MASSAIKLPPGFELEASPQAAAINLPPGFELEQPTQPQRTAMDSVKDFASEFGKQINPITGLQGAARAAAHPIETLKSDAAARQGIYTKAEEAFKGGNFSEGAAHLLYSMLPLMGPQLEEAGQHFKSGEYAKGAGMSTGMGVNMALPGAEVKLPLANAAKNVSKRMYQSALKPSKTYAASQISDMVNTGLDAGIPISSGGVKKLGSLIDDLQKKVKAKIQSGSASGVTVDPAKVASRTDSLKSSFSKQVNPNSDLAAIDAAKQEFLSNNPNPLSAVDAQEMKTGTYKQLKSKAYGGELGSAVVESQKALTRGIKEELEIPFPEIKGMNAQEGKFIGLDEAMETAVKRIENRDIFSLGGKISGGAGLAAGVVTGHEGLGAVAGVALHYVMSDPMVQSRLAIAVNRASKGKISITQARARIAGYANALGNASSADSSARQTSDQ